MSLRSLGFARRSALVVALALCMWVVPTRVLAQEQPAPAGDRAIFTPLYLSFVTVQALDAHSTLRALNHGGAVETNPLLGGIAGHAVPLLALKAGSAAATIYLVEKVRKQHRTAAIVLMAAINSAYATIAAHNYRAVR